MRVASPYYGTSQHHKNVKNHIHSSSLLYITAIIHLLFSRTCYQKYHRDIYLLIVSSAGLITQVVLEYSFVHAGIARLPTDLIVKVERFWNVSGFTWILWAFVS